MASLFRRTRGRRAPEVRYLVVSEWHKAPPKSWAKKPASYYAARLAGPRKSKAVGAREIKDYLTVRGLWLAVKVEAPNAADARHFLKLALEGNEGAAEKITVLADPFDLTKGTSLKGPSYSEPLKGTLPTRLQPELPPARFTIGRHKEDDPAERQRKKMGMGPGTASREAGEEIDPDTLNLSALAMGFYSQAGTDALEGMPGVKDHGFFTPHHRSPFQIGSVTTTRIGFAHLPMVEVTALAADPGGFTTSTARPLAIAFAKAVGIVFDLYSPTFGTRRDRISTDRNPASPSFGKNKKMSEVVVNFEIPHEQLKRLDAEKREWFGYGSSRSKPRWGRTEIDRWLGLDKVKELAAWRQGQGLDRPARKKERPPTPAGGAPVIPLRSSFGRVTEPEPTAPAPDLDAAQVQAGRAWAARKMATRGKAVAVARRKLQSRLSDRNRAFWSGVLAWGQNE